MGGAELAVLVLVLLGDPIMHERLIKVIGGFLFTSELEKKNFGYFSFVMIYHRPLERCKAYSFLLG